MIKIETNNPLIARFDDVMSVDLCNSIISYMMVEKPDKPMTGELPWLQSDNVGFSEVRDKKIRSQIDSYRFLFTQLVSSHYNRVVYPHFSDLVVWRKGMSMGYHKDNGYEGDDQNIFRNRKYSMVTYLNDDYLGGETVIRFLDGSEYVSHPRQGSVVIFKANAECEHCVNMVKKGTRYTLATWFATDISDCETVDKYE